MDGSGAGLVVEAGGTGAGSSDEAGVSAGSDDVGDSGSKGSFIFIPEARKGVRQLILFMRIASSSETDPWSSVFSYSPGDGTFCPAVAPLFPRESASSG